MLRLLKAPLHRAAACGRPGAGPAWSGATVVVGSGRSSRPVRGLQRRRCSERRADGGRAEGHWRSGRGGGEEDVLGWEERRSRSRRLKGSPWYRVREYGTSKQGREPWEGCKPGHHALHHRHGAFPVCLPASLAWELLDGACCSVAKLFPTLCAGLYALCKDCSPPGSSVLTLSQSFSDSWPLSP